MLSMVLQINVQYLKRVIHLDKEFPFQAGFTCGSILSTCWKFAGRKPDFLLNLSIRCSWCTTALTHFRHVFCVFQLAEQLKVTESALICGCDSTVASLRSRVFSRLQTVTSKMIINDGLRPFEWKLISCISRFVLVLLANWLFGEYKIFIVDWLPWLC